MRRRARPGRWRWLLLAWTALGCGGGGDRTRCHQDSDCGPDKACLSGSCVATVGGTVQVWSLEVSPGAQPRYALREYPDFPFTAERATLLLDRKISMATALEQKQPPPEIDFGTSVHVVVSVPSAIPGRGELQFEADGSSRAAFLPYEVNVTVPESMLGVKGRMRVLPMPPVDRYMPPWVLPVTLDSALSTALPTAADTLVFEGKLEPADPMSRLDVEYRARARVADQVVSNLALTNTEGKFVLRVQKSALGTGADGLSLELSPGDGMQALPSLLVAQVDVAKPGLGALRMPPFQKPEPYLVPVLDGEKKSPVVGATVRFTAELTGASVGAAAVYVRVAQTDSLGLAMIPLIPGAGDKTRDYTVKVTPPASSSLAARCVAGYSIGPATGGPARVAAAIELDPRVVLTGRVLDAEGAPAASVRLRATRVGAVFREECGSELVPPPSETTTDAEGRYRLWLDRGEYRLDCKPPLGAPLPMASERLDVPSSRTYDLTLPAPVLVEGRVVSPTNTPIAGAEVRAFGPGTSGVVERGVALSGPDGLFRLILPRRD